MLILLNQLFNNYQFEDALVSLKAPLGKLVLRLDFDGRINNINDLLFLENNSPLHSLGFLRLVCDNIILVNSEKSTVVLEWLE